MSRWKQWSAATAFALGAVTLGGPAAGAGPDARRRSGRGGRSSKRMTEFLDARSSSACSTQSTLEDLHESGHRVDHDLAANVVVKRPDRLRAMRVGGAMDQRFYYDGKTLTLYNPGEKVYATEKAPPTVEKMIDFARETVGIMLPAADLLYRGAFPLLTKDLKLAAVVGKTVIDGVKCDHLLFSRPGVDFQIWIAEGGKPWPRKYTVTETGTPALLSITTRAERLEHVAGRRRCRLQVRAAQGHAADPLHVGRAVASDHRQVSAWRTIMTTPFKLAAGLAIVIFTVAVVFAPDAQAFRGRGAAFAVGAAVGSSGDSAAEANAAAAQQQAATATQQAEVEKQKAITAQKEAEAEKQKAIAAQQTAAAGKPLPAGTVVTKLPAGCTPTPVGGKNYQYCGGTFYEPVYEGSTLKYVTATPK